MDFVSSDASVGSLSGCHVEKSAERSSCSIVILGCHRGTYNEKNHNKVISHNVNSHQKIIRRININYHNRTDSAFFLFCKTELVPITTYTMKAASKPPNQILLTS